MAAGLSSKRTKLYVHLDLDVLDPHDFPHVCVPEDEGVSFESMIKLLNGRFLTKCHSLVARLELKIVACLRRDKSAVWRKNCWFVRHRMCTSTSHN